MRSYVEFHFAQRPPNSSDQSIIKNVWRCIKYELYNNTRGSPITQDDAAKLSLRTGNVFLRYTQINLVNNAEAG